MQSQPIPNLRINTNIDIQCDRCFRLKTFCSGDQPSCTGCFQNGIHCNYSIPNMPSLSRNLSIDSTQFINQISNSAMSQRGNSYPPPNIIVNPMLTCVNTSQNLSNIGLSDLMPSFNSSPLYQSPTCNSSSSSILADSNPHKELGLPIPRPISPLPFIQHQSPSFNSNSLPNETRSQNDFGLAIPRAASPLPFMSHSPNRNFLSQSLGQPIIHLSPTENNSYLNPDFIGNLCQSPTNFSNPTIMLEPAENTSVSNISNNFNSQFPTTPIRKSSNDHLTVSGSNFAFPSNMTLQLPSEAVLAISYFFRNIHPLFPVITIPLFYQLLANSVTLTSELGSLIEAIVSLSRLHRKSPDGLASSCNSFLQQVDLSSYFPSSSTEGFDNDKTIKNATFLLDQLNSFHFANSDSF